MKHNPLRVVGARSTQHPELAVKRPNAMHIKRLKALDVRALAKHLGLDGKAHSGALGINRKRLMIYQHDEMRLDMRRHGHPRLALAFCLDGPPCRYPPSSSSIRDGMHYVVSAVYFSFDFPPIWPLPGLR